MRNATNATGYHGHRFRGRLIVEMVHEHSDRHHRVALSLYRHQPGLLSASVGVAGTAQANQLRASDKPRVVTNGVAANQAS